ncbi:MAG TPA: lysylphosphatidylglycerol synthase domain-containing protein [Pseudonocardiaceae bacterium]|nr:lysylphosphatidylglycerol synthase domain-containing protein [Pseudonocardiaceae bacterium]
MALEQQNRSDETVETVQAGEPSKPAMSSAAVLRATAIRIAKRFFASWFRRILLVAVLFGAGWTLYRNWPAVYGTLSKVPWEATAASELAVILGCCAGTLAWLSIVDGLGQPIGVLRGAQINLVGALGKYVPGSVWAYLLQMELGRKAGLARSRVFTSSLIQFGVSLVVTVIFAALAIPAMFPHSSVALLLYALVVVGLVLLHPKFLLWGANLVLRVLRRKQLDHPLRLSTVGKTLLCQTVSYVLFGVQLWIMADAIGVVHGMRGFLLCVGAVVVGLNSGVVAFVLPSGAGVRDGVIVALLITTMPYGPALALAVVSRLMFTVADMVTAGVAAGLARWRTPLPAATATEPVS